MRGQVGDGELNVVQIAPPARGWEACQPTARLSSGSPAAPGIRHLIAGTLTPAQAVKEDVVTILKGNVKLLERFTELFRIDT